MKKSVFVLVAFAIMFVGIAGTNHADEETATLNGSFVWEQGNTTGDLEAIFTPSGEGMWDVSFNFMFRDKPHTYSGTAKGSLSEGVLEGTVRNENKKRKFLFEGAFVDGVFTGTHAEFDGEETFSTGTMTLR